MATIERRTGDRHGYSVRWRGLDGRERRRKCPDKATAVQLQAEIEACIARGVDWQPRPVRDRTTLPEVATAFLDFRRVRCAPATVRADGVHLDMVARFLDERRVRHLDALTRPLLDDLLGWLLRPGTGHKGGTRQAGSASRTVMVALSLWRWAEDSGRFWDAPRAPRDLHLPRYLPAPVVAPTWAEMDAVIARLGESTRVVATWLRYTGLRVGESLRVEWRDVDMGRGELTIRPEVDKMRIGRTMPLHPLLLDLLAGMGRREGYVLPSRSATREPNRRGLARAWEAEGVREEVWAGRPDHAFRRGFKTGLLELGANADAVDFLQGHRLGEGARGRYVDGSRLPLRETLAMVPAIGVPGASRSNVVGLTHRRHG